MAIEGLGDLVEIELLPDREILLSVTGVGSSSIPVDPSLNSAGAVLEESLRLYDYDSGIRVHVTKGTPPGKGLGSSGASAAATAYAVNTLLNLGLKKNELSRLAAAGEKAVSGAPHADNITASLFGGFTITGPNFDVIRLDPPDMELVTVVPDIDYPNKTWVARSYLPKSVEFSKAVDDTRSATRMSVAVALGDPVLFGKSISDSIVESCRAQMIPHYWKVKEAALEAGGYGCSIAGGGPSVFAVGPCPEEIGQAMCDVFLRNGVRSQMFITRPSITGATEV